jgi:hypothetical protein
VILDLGEDIFGAGGRPCEVNLRGLTRDRFRFVFGMFGSRSPNRSDKTIAALGNGFDKGSFRIALAQNLAQDRDVFGQICFFNKGILPDLFV